jgi:hypothetical protein
MGLNFKYPLFLVISIFSFCSNTFSLASPSKNEVIELDLITFRNLLLKDQDRDSLVFFYHTNGAEEANDMALQISSFLQIDASSSIRVAVLDYSTHGVPLGLHLHAPKTSFFLFPALNREPIVYNTQENHHHKHDHDYNHNHDHSEDSCKNQNDENHEHHHNHDHDHDHDHEHEHSSFSLIDVIDFLKKHSTFPAEIPSLSISTRWKGRTNELFEAVSNGMIALKEQMNELQNELTRVQNELKLCRLKNTVYKEERSEL